MPPPPFRPLRPFPGIVRPVPIAPLAPLPIAPLPITPLTPIVVPGLAPAPASRARFDALIEELRRLRGEMNRSVHRCGVILRELSQPGMLAFGGVTELGDLLEAYDLGSRFSAMKYIAVAEQFTEDEATQLGVERSYAIIRGAAALPEPLPPRTLLAQNPKITVGPLTARLNAAPLRALLGWVGGLTTSTAPAPTKRMFKDADSARDKLQRRFAAAGLAKTKMRLTKRGGAYVLRVELAIEDVAALAAVVRKAP